MRDSRFEFAPSRLKEKAYIEERINNVLINERAGYWLEKLENARIPCARVNNVSQAMSDPQIMARNMVVDLKHPLKGSAQVPGNPIKLSETNEDSYSPPPLLGAHNDEVLKEWLNKG